MGLLIVKTDFVGKYAVAQDAYSKMDSYIAKYEEHYLMELLGVELFKLFKDDVDVPTKLPVTPIYLNIFNPIREDDSNNFCLKRIRISDGIKEMLLGFIYFEYIRDQKYLNTPSGTVVNQSENSRESGFDEGYIYDRYNEAIKSMHTIQWYICKNKTDYPKYNGIYKKKSYLI